MGEDLEATNFYKKDALKCYIKFSIVISEILVGKTLETTTLLGILLLVGILLLLLLVCLLFFYR